MGELFNAMDVDKGGAVDFEEVEHFLESEMGMAHLEFLGIDSSDAKTLFHLLDNGQSGTINVEDFVRGCLNLRGNAKTLHVAKLEQEVQFFQDVVMKIDNEMQSKLKEAG